MKRMFREDSGFTIAEYVMAAAILLFVSIAVMGTLAYAANSSAGTSRRETALALANQRLEQARNMPYDAVGTVNGYPVGTIPAVDTVDAYTVTTSVEWAVDSVTSLSSCKTIRVAVSWAGSRPGSIDVESNIAGKSTVANAGDVKVFVIDADTGDPIPGASVTMKPSTGFAATKSTDASGSVRWGKVPAGAIKFTGTATGYALDVAPLSTATVTSGVLNTWTIQAVKPSTAVITVRDQVNAVLPNVVVTLNGPSGTVTGTSNSMGVATITGLIKGTYTVTGALTGYSPTATSIVIVAGGQSYPGSLKMTKSASLTVTVKDVNGVAIKDVSLAISPAAGGPLVTNASGIAVFNLGNAGVAYTVTASKGGYATKSVTTPVISAGQDATLAIQLVVQAAEPGTLSVNFRYGKNDYDDHTIYVFNGTSSSLTKPYTKSYQFTRDSSRDVSTSFTLPAGWYWVSFSQNPSNAERANYLNEGGTVSVTVDLGND